MSDDEFLQSRDLHEDALDNLTKALRNAVANRFGEYGWEECEQVAEAILRQHAHELAEEIRARALESWDEMKPLAYAEGREDGLQAAADLIDPEVTE